MRKWLGVNPGDGAPVYEKIEEDGTKSTTSDYVMLHFRFQF
jgi:hypothetical protein